MKHEIQLTVNGQIFHRSVSSRTTLAELLRELGFLGVHSGCDLGQCGACTVLIGGVSVKSCLMLGVQAAGAHITTVEGLAKPDGSPHPLQEAFSRHFAIQCGFCTSGMLMAAKGLLDQNPRPSEAEIRDWLAGNLCRCTGYVNIVRAIQDAAEVLAHEEGT